MESRASTMTWKGVACRASEDTMATLATLLLKAGTIMETSRKLNRTATWLVGNPGS